MKTIKYSCPKCGHNKYEAGEMYVSGSFWSKIFNIQNRKYTTLTCSRCTYTEFFKIEMNKIGNVFDFFVG
jgi:hypothetical protein